VKIRSVAALSPETIPIPFNAMGQSRSVELFEKQFWKAFAQKKNEKHQSFAPKCCQNTKRKTISG